MGECRSSESNYRLVPTTFPLHRFPVVYAVDADPPIEDGAVEDDAEESDPCLCRRGEAAGDDADPPITDGAAAVDAEAPGIGLSFRGGASVDTVVGWAMGWAPRLFGAIKFSWRSWLGRSGGAPSLADASDGLGAVEPPPRESLDCEADAPLDTPTCSR